MAVDQSTQPKKPFYACAAVPDGVSAGQGVNRCASTRWRTVNFGAVFASSQAASAVSKAATSASGSDAPTPRQARIRPRQPARVNGTSASNQNIAATLARPAAQAGSVAMRPDQSAPCQAGLTP